MFPTLAYVEDQLSARPDALLLCGFGSAGEEFRLWLATELNIPTALLTSRLGEPGEFNAGLLGYLESCKET